ncbi:MAG TPA: HyaD/HybD family hydrogenase maturation endopeptidase [Thermodesulfobacteriota bacterium]|nr:HyaD/HybD family hydrogenase maturation endopeptidase [Thermodesulfobacteriota bacterium]
MKNNILVIGLGNILLRDEGVGVHAIRILKERYRFDPCLEIIDGGTLGLDLLPFLETGDKVLFVDAIDFGKKPGYIGEIEDDEILPAFQTKLSVHHIGLSDLLLAAKWMDLKPVKICLIGIQPESVEMGLEMTDCIIGKLTELVDWVFQKLKAWGATCALQSL